MLSAPSYVSSLGVSLLLLGIAWLILPTLDRRDWRARSVVLGLAVLLAWRYVAWRLGVTVPPFAWKPAPLLAWGFALLETLTIISSTSAFLILTRTRSRSREVDENARWWGANPPRVDIYIATYNEEAAVLERSLAGAITTAYPAARIFVLDDGRRPWLAAMTAHYGVDYLTRPDNDHAKAGNLNHAFRRRRAEEDAPDFVAVLDADFVPHRDFVSRSLALFHDRSVGLVQTPQHFFNEDPIQHNLHIGRGYPDEQRFFFDHLEASRDAWGIAVCCGTSSMVRAEALEAIGGFPTESVTEDFLLTVKLGAATWRTVYLNEALTEGLAPEGLQEYIVQRGRWCLGMMEILRGGWAPWTSRPLGLAQRWSLADSGLYWISTFPFRLASLLCPLLYWYFGLTVVNATIEDVLAYYVPFNVATLIALNWLSGGLVVPILNDVSQLLAAWPITRAAAMGLFMRGPHKFRVTAKGGDRTRTVVQWPLMRPFLVLAGLTIAGLLSSTWRDVNFDEVAGEGMYVVLFWTMYNLLVLLVAILACIERPRRDAPDAFRPEPVSVVVEGRSFRPWLTSLGVGSAELRGLPAFAVGTPLQVEIEGIGAVMSDVSRSTPEAIAVTLSPSAEQIGPLFVRLHAATATPSTTRGSLDTMLRQVARTFRARSSGQV
jgi:cellulose synthase (UDP-forming)